MIALLRDPLKIEEKIAEYRESIRGIQNSIERIKRDIAYAEKRGDEIGVINARIGRQDIARWEEFLVGYENDIRDLEKELEELRAAGGPTLPELEKRVGTFEEELKKAEAERLTAAGRPGEVAPFRLEELTPTLPATTAAIEAIKKHYPELAVGPAAAPPAAPPAPAPKVSPEAFIQCPNCKVSNRLKNWRGPLPIAYPGQLPGVKYYRCPRCSNEISLLPSPAPAAPAYELKLFLPLTEKIIADGRTPWPIAVSIKDDQKQGDTILISAEEHGTVFSEKRLDKFVREIAINLVDPKDPTKTKSRASFFVKTSNRGLIPITAKYKKGTAELETVSFTISAISVDEMREVAKAAAKKIEKKVKEEEGKISVEGELKIGPDLIPITGKLYAEGFPGRLDGAISIDPVSMKPAFERRLGEEMGVARKTGEAKERAEEHLRETIDKLIARSPHEIVVRDGRIEGGIRIESPWVTTDTEILVESASLWPKGEKAKEKRLDVSDFPILITTKTMGGNQVGGLLVSIIGSFAIVSIFSGLGGGRGLERISPLFFGAALGGLWVVWFMPNWLLQLAKHLELIEEEEGGEREKK